MIDKLFDLDIYQNENMKILHYLLTYTSRYLFNHETTLTFKKVRLSYQQATNADRQQFRQDSQTRK